MNVYEYEHEKKNIKTSCRLRFGLIIGGLAALLIGGKFIMKSWDIDITKHPWNIVQIPLYAGIGAVTVYYAMKEPEELHKLHREYEKSQKNL